MIALTTEPPSQHQRRIAAASIALSLLIFLALAPFANLPVGRSELYLPIYESSLVTCDLLTCVFLFGQFVLARPTGVLILSAGYLFSATMALLHELSFPGLFAPAGLLWANGQTTAWLYFLWHLGFPLAVFGFARSAERPVRVASVGAMRWVVSAAVLGALGAAALALLVATAGAHLLPKLMHGNQDRPAKSKVAWATWLVILAVLPILWRRVRYSGLHLWVLVVSVAWACDLAQAAVFNAGRFSLGWYTGRAFGLLAACTLLAVMTLENGRLYRRLTESHAAECEQRRLAEQRSAQLNRLSASLEARVGARTGELQSANEALRRARDELRAAATLGSAVRESERARLARELHDELGQALVTLKYKVAELETYCRERGTPMSEEAHGMLGLIDQTIDSARRVAADLRPAVLDVLGLSAAVEWLVSGFRKLHSFDVQLRIEPAQLQVAEPGATVVFRVLQEALTNIVRHAHATHVQIEILQSAAQLTLCVRDDGRGFDPEVPRRADALGVLGMRERTLTVDGALDIRSVPGRGTTVTLSIPSAAPENSSAV
ncbi:MAG: sensor histidine kinase [Steroidobacteraceae bacterium]